VVSSNQLGAKEADVANAIALMSGPRVRHYWDGERRVGSALEPFVTGLDGPAWDFWMLYAPGVTWPEQGMPQPDWWEHQLSALWDRFPDRRLDAGRFAAKAVELEARAAGR
jgi:hypothetical protein